MTEAKVYRIDPGARSAAEVSAASWIYQHLAAGLESRPPMPTRNSHLRGRMLAQLRELLQNNLRTVRAADGDWRAFAPGVSIKLLRRDAATYNMTAFIRMQPGAALDSHAHTQSEECLILEGEIYIGAHRLCAGDMHVAAAGTVHAPTTSPRGALILLRAACPDH